MYFLIRYIKIRIYLQMDDVLELFIDLNYTQELGYELLRSFQIFDHFNYKDPYEELVSLVMSSDNKDKTEVADIIIFKIREAQDYLFRAHCLTISSDSSIEHRNELLLALALFMQLEDYDPILTVLYSDGEDIEKFSSIVTDICMLSEEQIYRLVEDIDPIIFETMKKFIDSRAVGDEEFTMNKPNASSIASVKAFKECISEDALGVKMLESGAFAGAPFSSYLPFIKKDILIESNLQKSANNLVSLLLLSHNGNNAPIITYKKHIDQLTDNLAFVQQLEPLILKTLTDLDNYTRARNDQKRVS